MAEALPAPDVASFPELEAGDLIGDTDGRRIWRIYRRAGSHPGAWGQFRSYGPTSSRFDHQVSPPHEQDRAILYGALDQLVWVDGVDWGKATFAALAEFFQESRTIDAVDEGPALTVFKPIRQLALLDLIGPWTTRAGGNQAICAAAHDTAREWARAIYDHYSWLEGVLCTAQTYGPGRTAALWERAQSALPLQPLLDVPLADPRFASDLRRAASHLGYDLVLGPQVARSL